MPEINIDIEYFDHRKTNRLKLRFGEDAAIYPIKIWAYAARHHPIDGLFAGYSDDEIAAVMSASSNAISILKAMLDVGFLDRTPAGIAVHGWAERQGHIVAYHKRAVHAANTRWAKLGKKEGNDATSNASSIPKHATSNALQEASLVSNDSSFELKPNTDQTARALEAHAFVPGLDARAKAVMDAYPHFSKDGRQVQGFNLDTQSRVIAAIRKAPDFPWEEAATLENQNAYPTDFGKWIAAQPDQVALEHKRKASKPKEMTNGELIASEFIIT